MVFFRLVCAISHGEHSACGHRRCHVHRLCDLPIGCPHLLRTREVGNRSRLTVVCQDEREVHQLFGLGVQRPGRVRILEVLFVVFVAVEVTSAGSLA